MFQTDEANGINAMLAHEARVADDNTFVRGIVESYVFLGFGTVQAYSNEHVTVSYGKFTYTNVEVMVIGVDGWGIKPVPAAGDRVLLFSTQHPIADIKKFKASGSMPAYDASGLKAIPVTDSKTAQMLTVSKDKIELTGKNTFTLDDSGLTFEDANGNKGTTSDSGVELEDKNGNKITADDSGVAFEDKNGNKITTSSDGVAFEDKNSNKVTTDSNGIATEDKNGNKYTGTSSGTVIDAKGGCKIEMGASSVKINNKLEILKN